MALTSLQNLQSSFQDEEAKKQRQTKDASGRLVDTTAQGASTPLGASGVGGNPHQAKMAGTPAQALSLKSQTVTAAAPASAPKNTQTISAVKDQQARRSTATAEELQLQTASQNLVTGSKHADDRVQSLAMETAGKKSSDSKDIITSNSIKALLPKGYEAPGVSAAIDNIAGALQAGGTPSQSDLDTLANDPEALRSIVGNLANTSGVDLMNAVTSKFKSVSENIRMLGDAPALTYDELLMSNANLYQDLGISEDEAKELLQSLPAGATAQEFIEGVTEKKSADFSRVQSLASRLQDPSITPAEKENIRRELADLAASGVAGAEAAANEALTRLNEDVTKVDVDGDGESQDWSTELGGTHLADVMKGLEDAMASNDPNVLARWRAENKNITDQFLSDVRENTAALEGANKGVDEASGVLKERAAKAAKVNTHGGTRLDDAVVEAAGGSNNVTNAVEANIPSMNALPPDSPERESLAVALNQAKGNPELLKAMMNFNPNNIPPGTAGGDVGTKIRNAAANALLYRNLTPDQIIYYRKGVMASGAATASNDPLVRDIFNAINGGNAALQKFGETHSMTPDQMLEYVHSKALGVRNSDDPVLRYGHDGMLSADDIQSIVRPMNPQNRQEDLKALTELQASFANRGVDTSILSKMVQEAKTDVETAERVAKEKAAAEEKAIADKELAEAQARGRERYRDNEAEQKLQEAGAVLQGVDPHAIAAVRSEKGIGKGTKRLGKKVGIR